MISDSWFSFFHVCKKIFWKWGQNEVRVKSASIRFQTFGSSSLLLVYCWREITKAAYSFCVWGGGWWWGVACQTTVQYFSSCLHIVELCTVFAYFSPFNLLNKSFNSAFCSFCLSRTHLQSVHLVSFSMPLMHAHNTQSCKETFCLSSDNQLWCGQKEKYLIKKIFCVWTFLCKALIWISVSSYSFV